jgi:phosphatidylinositol alpha-1,6-mannosyltransferase
MSSKTSGGAVALLVTRNFPPLLGGMENVNQRLLAELAAHRRVVLCGPEGSAAHAPQAVQVSEARLRPLPRFILSAAARAATLAWRWRPQLVIAGSGLAAPMAWLAARLSGARTVVYLHGLDIVAPSAVYQRLWLPFIRAMQLVLVNSANTASLAIRAGVRPERVHILHPGTDIPVLDPEAGPRFRTALGLGDEPLLLSVGRLTRRKGLAEFVAGALPQIVVREPRVRLLILGEEAADALHGGQGSERARIESAAEAAGMASRVSFIGRRAAAELSAAYQAAQLHVFPVLDQPGDVEGFGMVALEAAAHGLRTVAFRVGGVPDAVAEPASGSLVEPGDYEGFAQATCRLLEEGSSEATREAARRFARDKDWTAFGVRLRSLLPP